MGKGGRSGRRKFHVLTAKSPRHKNDVATFVDSRAVSPWSGLQGVAREERHHYSRGLEEGRHVLMRSPSVGGAAGALSHGGSITEACYARNKFCRGDLQRKKLKAAAASKIQQVGSAVRIQRAFRRSQQVLSYFHHSLRGGYIVASCGR